MTKTLSINGVTFIPYTSGLQPGAIQPLASTLMNYAWKKPVSATVYHLARSCPVHFAYDWVNKIKRRAVNIIGSGFKFREVFFERIDDDFIVFKRRLSTVLS